MDDTQGNKTVEEIQPTAIPTEIKPTEATEPKLPDGVAERTAAEFEKLKEHNAQLKTQLDAYKGKTSVLDDLRPSTDVQVETPSLSGTQVQEIKSRFIDDNGFVDVARVEEALTNAETVARQANERAERVERKIQNSEESEIVKVAHTEFPQLDPHNVNGVIKDGKLVKFDQDFYESVKDNLTGQMIRGEQDILKAARKVSEHYKPIIVEAPIVEADVEKKEKIAKRNQATEIVTGRGKGEPSDLDELKIRTQQGDQDALFKRLQASGN
jgi:hypothetical protein